MDLASVSRHAVSDRSLLLLKASVLSEEWLVRIETPLFDRKS
jgi:hypothetical protein